MKAVTLLELTVTIVIIGILAAIAIPMFPRAMEATKAKEAVAALQQIRTGERIYRVQENDYWPVGSTETDHRIINDTLRVFLDTRADPNWTYSVTADTMPADDIFNATATRQGGPYDQGTISIDENGLISEGNGWPPSLLPGQ